MFLGEYRYTLDGKFRLTLPAKFRPQLASGLVLTSGTDACVLIYPAAEFEQVYDRITALPLTGPEAAEFRRLMFMNASDLEMDKQGRVLVPEGLRDYADIGGANAMDVVVVGVGKFIELWSPARWQAMKSKIQDHSTQAAIWSRLGI